MAPPLRDEGSTIKKLSEELSRALGRHGHSEKYRIALTAVSVHCLLLGMGAATLPSLYALAEDDEPHQRGLDVLRTLSDVLVTDELCGWVQGATPSEVAAFRDCLLVSSRADLAQMSREEDVLGFLYADMRHHADRKWKGAYPTPLSVARLMAEILHSGRCEPGTSIYDPTVGTGTMFIASAMNMRKNGSDPTQVKWYGQDIDAMALALCGVNQTYRGLVKKTGEGLVLTGHVAAALRLMRGETPSEAPLVTSKTDMSTHEMSALPVMAQVMKTLDEIAAVWDDDEAFAALGERYRREA